MAIPDARWRLFVAAFAAGVLCTINPIKRAAGLEPHSDLHPFEQTIPGTTVSFDMIPVPAGTIKLSDPSRPGEELTVDVGPLWVAETETPWEAYDVFVYRLDQAAVMDDEPERGAGGDDAEADAISRPSKPYISMDRGFGHNGYPAISMSFKGASAYCEWLSKKTGRNYRLPTEAEWRYIMSEGGRRESFADHLDAHAWHDGNAEGTTHPVATKKPNEWGVYDGLGNAAEWCAGLDGAPVALGGSFRDDAEDVTLDARRIEQDSWNASDPQIPKSQWWFADGPFVGFRVVCDPAAN